jgi:hypothetical protein
VVVVQHPLEVGHRVNHTIVRALLECNIKEVMGAKMGLLQYQLEVAGGILEEVEDLLMEDLSIESPL